MKVIVADDSKVMRRIVIRTLRQAGYEWDVVEAENGLEALQLVQSQHPDLVLSDWNMPEMTGIDLLRSLRASGWNTPVGFVTSEGSQQMRDMADEAGALFLIAKPFTAESFKDAIEAVMV